MFNLCISSGSISSMKLCTEFIMTNETIPRADAALHKKSKIPRACPVESHVCSYQNSKAKGVPMPRACPVERHVSCYLATNVKLHGTSPWHPDRWVRGGVATSVILHGTSPWHPERGLDHRCSDERNTPRDKPVASRRWV